MLYWAAAVAIGGVAYAFAAAGRGGFGPEAAFVAAMAVGIAGLMAFTHWLCRRKGWK